MAAVKCDPPSSRKSYISLRSKRLKTSESFVEKVCENPGDEQTAQVGR